MTKPTSYSHPNAIVYTVQQWGAVLLLALMGIAAAGLVGVAVVLGAPLFALMGVLVVLLTAPVWMLLSATPPLTLTDKGIMVESAVLPSQTIRWDDIQAVKPYPLLPTPDHEVMRRAFVGRQKYNPAEGVMLIVPGLPPVYRIAGFFAGQRGVPIIAVTNRTHANYDALLNRLQNYISIEDA